MTTISLSSPCVFLSLVLWRQGFLETYALLFTSYTNDTEKSAAEVAAGNRRAFNISWLVGGHPILEPYMLMSEANRTFGILLTLLQFASSLPVSLAVTVVNWSLQLFIVCCSSYVVTYVVVLIILYCSSIIYGCNTFSIYLFLIYFFITLMDE